VPSGVSDTLKKAFQNVPEFGKLVPADTEKVLEGALNVLSTTCFNINIPVINLIISYTDPTKTSLSLTGTLLITAGVSIDISTTPSIIVQAISGTITTNMPELDGIINSAIVPFVIDYVNKVSKTFHTQL
jgi:hypothetical protein